MRERAVSFVRDGGQRHEACRLFKIDPKTLYNWLSSSDLRAKSHSLRHRKVCPRQLAEHVKAYPDALLRERAKHFGVYPNAIAYRLKQLQVSKKNDEV